MTQWIMAVDPGKTSGLALYDRTAESFESFELDFDRTCSTALENAQSKGTDLLIVCESFLITQQTPKNTQAPWSLELIGVMRFLSRTYCGRDITLQAPASAKRFSSDERLRSMGFWTRGKGHANDAARHLLLTLAGRGWLDHSVLVTLAET